MIFDLRTVGRLVACLVIGVAIGVVGSAVHRALPWGLALALVTVVAAGIFARSWGGGATVVAVGLGVAVTVGVMSLEGPGGDVLIVPDAVGWAWSLGAVLAGVAFVLPASWFRDEPVGRSGGPDA